MDSKFRLPLGWPKVKLKLSLDVTVTGGSAEVIPWGDQGQAVMLELRHGHSRQNTQVTFGREVRVPGYHRHHHRLGLPARLRSPSLSSTARCWEARRT